MHVLVQEAQQDKYRTVICHFESHFPQLPAEQPARSSKVSPLVQTPNSHFQPSSATMKSVRRGDVRPVKAGPVLMCCCPVPAQRVPWPTGPGSPGLPSYSEHNGDTALHSAEDCNSEAGSAATGLAPPRGTHASLNT